LAITLDEYITFFSFGISLASLVIVMYCLSILRKPPTLEYHAPKPSTSNDNELEVSAIVSEFTQRLKRLEEGLVDQKVKLEI